MATLLHSESRRLYSWWWDSHISPKNSKWLQENLTDMDAKVKAMIKLIEEDADSFARRAEMYYKKRPELMKLVEEFYRAYRALAERYDHATVELRQAHRTMAEAFPNQVHYVLADDSSSGPSVLDSEPRTPEMPHTIHSLLDPDDLANLRAMRSNGGYSEESDSEISKRGLKQLNEMFVSGEAAPHISKVAEGKMKMAMKLCEVAEGDTERLETEVQTLKKTLAKIEAEKDAVLLQYQQSLQKLSSLEKELKDVGGLSERASRAEKEIKILKETLSKLEAERDASLLQSNKCLGRISSLENMISQTKEDAKGLNERAIKAELEAQNLRQELSGLEAEKEAGLLQYNQCLEMISALKKKISDAEENSRMLNELIEIAETEVNSLKQALARLKEEKAAAELQYEHCLERITMMESEISHAQDNVKWLNSEILTAAEKLKGAEEQCCLLERANQHLQFESDNLAKKIAMKDLELSEKEKELESLQTLIQDEQSRFVEVEAALRTLQKLHSQCQEELRALALELQNRLQVLKDFEKCNHDLLEDLKQVKEENQCLNEVNHSSSISITNLQNENHSLKELTEKLEQDVALQMAQSNSLQQEICCLKEEMEGLNRGYQVLMEQVQLAGLNPECLGSSVKNLQDENLKLKEVCNRDKEEKELLHEKLRNMNELLQKNVALERTVSELNGKLEGSTEKAKELQDSCQLLQEEKSGIVAEKAILLSQLKIMTENVQKLLEKNALLENSLSGANVELEGLRTKSKTLEEFCHMLNDEKSHLLNEKSTIVSQLESVEQSLGILERRFTKLEEKYIDLEKEKESALCQVKELWSYLGVEKQEGACHLQSSGSRLGDLENQVHLLQQESRFSKKEFEEELDKAVNAQVEIFILQKFIEDLEQKNISLLLDCQKYVEASKLSDKLISELETENLEQQVEVEFLLDEIEKLRMGIHQVLQALQFYPRSANEVVMEKERSPLVNILFSIEDFKSSILRNEDEKQKLTVENLVLLTFLRQLSLDGAELESQKKILEQEFKTMTEQCTIMHTEKHELLEFNRQLKFELGKGQQQEEVLKVQLEAQCMDLTSLQDSYLALQEENSKLLGENRYLLQKFSQLRKEMDVLDEQNDGILQEAVVLGNHLAVFKSFGTEKLEELEALSLELIGLRGINGKFKKKVEMLGEELEKKETETLHLKGTIEKFLQDLNESKDLNDQLDLQILLGRDFLRQKAVEVSQAEEQLKAMHDLKEDFLRTIEELKRECEESKLAREKMEKQILEQSKDSLNQKEVIECLHKSNENLELELDVLCKEVEVCRMREEILNLELQERSNESELWEAEASSFYFDLQISSIHEVLLENKVHDLTTACESLEDENATKDMQIGLMKERFGLLESEIGRLKAQLSAYGPAIASLKQNIDSIEQNTLLQTKHFVTNDRGQMGVDPCQMSHHELMLDEGMEVIDGISDLLRLQTRIKAVEKAVVEKRLAAEKAVVEEVDGLEMQERTNTNAKLEAPLERAEQLELRSMSSRETDFQKGEIEPANEPTSAAKFQKNKVEISEVRSGILMKDIPLDHISDFSFYMSERKNVGANNQMLELWESAEQDWGPDHTASSSDRATAHNRIKHAKQKSWDLALELQVEKELGVDKLEISTSISGEPEQEGKRGKILERLTSDGQKLMYLQTTVQDLKRQMEIKKMGKKADDLEFERVERQLLEVEESVVQLVDTNGKLKKTLEKTSTLQGDNSEEAVGEVYSKRVTEQAQKGSAKIGQMQFEVQSIQYILLKLDDEKKSKVKHRFSGAGIALKDFMGWISIRKKKKSRFCGFARPSTNED